MSKRLTVVTIDNASEKRAKKLAGLISRYAIQVERGTFVGSFNSVESDALTGLLQRSPEVRSTITRAECGDFGIVIHRGGQHDGLEIDGVRFSSVTKSKKSPRSDSISRVAKPSRSIPAGQKGSSPRSRR